jgi:hypothetical protein
VVSFRWFRWFRPFRFGRFVSTFRFTWNSLFLYKITVGKITVVCMDWNISKGFQECCHRWLYVIFLQTFWLISRAKYLRWTIEVCCSIFNFYSLWIGHAYSGLSQVWLCSRLSQVWLEFLRARRICYCLNWKELIKNLISSSRELVRQKIRANKFASGKQALLIAFGSIGLWI